MITFHSEYTLNRQNPNPFQLQLYSRDYSKNLFVFKSYRDTGSPPFQVLLTECKGIQYPRSLKFDEAKKKEVDSLICRKKWKTVFGKDVPNNANNLTGRFVLAWKEEGTDQEILESPICR